MTLPAGTSCIVNPEDRMRSTLAASTSYRTFIGAADGAEALASIFVDAQVEPDDYEKYTADEWLELFEGSLIWLDSENGFNIVSDSEDGYITNGQIWVRLRRIVPEDDRNDGEKAQRDFKNLVGVILTDIVSQSVGGRIEFSTIRMKGPYVSKKNDEHPDPWLMVIFQFDWYGALPPPS